MLAQLSLNKKGKDVEVGRRSNTLSLILIVIVTVGLYIYKPISLYQITTIEGFIQYARSLGAVMPIAIFFITIGQAIVPVIPFVILCSANSLLFGMLNGTLLTWVGTLVGASITFYFSRRFGLEWAARNFKSANFKKIDQITGFNGFVMILTLRLLPYFPAPLINVTAGVSSINFLWFFLASAIVKLPIIIGYSYLGFNLMHSKNYLLGVGVMLTLMVLPYLLFKLKGTKLPQKNTDK